MNEGSDLWMYLAIWALAIIAIVWQTWKAPGAGLMLAYCFQMVMLYWMGAFIHVLPWADLPDTEMVYLGFQQCTYAVLAFAVGSLVVGPWIVKKKTKRQSKTVDPDRRLPRAYIAYGIGSYFILAPTLGTVKGFSAIASVGSQLVVVGCCLSCWIAWNAGGKRALLRALGPTLLIPAVTVVVQGFLGFGVMALATVMIFCAQFFRPRWILVVGMAVSCYVGMSIYTTYMKGRNELRAVVWEDTSRFSDKIDKLLETAQGFEFFDPTDNDHLEMVDGRLNQDTLVGSAVSFLGNTDGYARGDTLREAVIAMVPRLIWPDKPISAGSGGLVTRFTGMEFAEGTSVGVGPVMELYANFGTPAVVVGFILIGLMVKFLDVMAGINLARGDWHGFATYCLVGISFLNVGGSFVEVTMGAVASLLLAKFVNMLLKRFKKKAPPVSIDQGAELVRA